MPLTALRSALVVSRSFAISGRTVVHELLPPCPRNEEQNKNDEGQHDHAQIFHHFFPSVPSKFESVTTAVAPIVKTAATAIAIGMFSAARIARTFAMFLIARPKYEHRSKNYCCESA